MPEAVRTPSGILLDLERPQLRRLLCYGALGARELADACMDRASVAPGDLTAEDLLAVACWGLEHLGGDDDALTLAALCETYATPPSARLGITDRLLAFEADKALRLALADYSEGHDSSTGSGIAPDDPLYGFPKEDA